MIETDESVGELAFRCDRCTNLSDSFSLADFQSAVDTIKADGWKVKRDHRVEGGWSHECPDHTGANRVKDQRRLLGF